MHSSKLSTSAETDSSRSSRTLHNPDASTESNGTTDVKSNIAGRALDQPRTRKTSHDGTEILPYQQIVPDTLVQSNPIDGFPVFKNGDVIIRTKIGRISQAFQLHSAVLTRHSHWFANSLRNSIPENEKPTWYEYTIEETDYKIQLVRQRTQGVRPQIELPDRNQEGRIKAEDEDQGEVSLSRVTSVSAPTSRSSSSLNPPEPHRDIVVALYSQILGSFYSIPLQIPTEDITASLAQAEILVKIASELDCLHLITAQLGNTFSQYRRKLFIAIKSDPARWILLSIELRNETIYTEALIHLVGAHPAWPWSMKRALPKDLRRLVADKSKQLDQLCLEIERDLLMSTIQVRNGPVEPQAISDYNTWFVVQLFRDGMARTFHELERDKRSSLKRGTLFRKISRGGSAYMEYEEMSMLVSRVMPSCVQTLGEDLRLLKEDASEVVKEVAENGLMIDPDAYEMGYLTCVQVNHEDLPCGRCGMAPRGNDHVCV